MYSVWELFYGVQHVAPPPLPPSAPHPPPLPQGHPQRWLILGVICLAQLTVLLDNTVLNVAIPSLTRELGAATADIQWMINAYSLVQSGLLLTAGSAADRYGRKKLLLAGLAAVRRRLAGRRSRAVHRPADRRPRRAWASAARC